MGYMDLSGQTFGYLKVIGDIPAKRAPIYWSCQCVCGKMLCIAARGLRRGGSKSCGCRRAEFVSVAATKHGMNDTAEYRSWSDMKRRCTNPSHVQWDYYGGRGITVC